MKTLLLILITWMALPAFSQTRKEKEAAKEENVRKALEADRYTIDINYMIPSKGPGRPLTTDYSVTVRNDSLISYLPYAGRAYSIPYGGGKALNFSAPIENYEKKTKKKVKLKSPSASETMKTHTSTGSRYTKTGTPPCMSSQRKGKASRSAERWI